MDWGAVLEEEHANRDTNRNFGENSKLEPVLGNYFIFTELIEDVRVEVYKVQFGGAMKCKARTDIILKRRRNSDIVFVLIADCFTLFWRTFTWRSFFPRSKLSNTNLNFRRKFPPV